MIYYALQSTGLVLFCLHNHFSSPVLHLKCYKWKIGLKIVDFVPLTPFLTPILAYIAPINGNNILIRLD